MSEVEEAKIKYAQRQARIIGILYGALVGLELAGDKVTHSAIFSIMQKHCTQSELIDAINEVSRFARVLEQL